MPKKHRSKSKGRKSKGFDSPKKGTRDDITGMTVEVDGIGRITSDEKYEAGSTLVEFFPKTNGAPFVQVVELEFGSKEYVVMTTKLSNDGTTRSVLQGAFGYKDGKVASARVDAMASVSQGPNSTYGYGDIVTFGGGVSISNPQSAYSWQSALSGNPGTTVASYDLDNGSVVTGSKDPFIAFGGGKFYQEGWTSNPFDSNLI